ncbi:MAG: hypothetical protein BroJett030_06690 [Alphaproteobacteria bacterium]|nr:MAG: hypothetical protein BroJett030_06690 [Alphaproteobacteria bacterium]
MRHNHLAIWVTVALHMVLGFLWYSPFLFLDGWAAGFRIDAAAMAQPNPAALVLALAGAAISCYVASWLIQRLGVADATAALGLAVALWAGFVFAALAPHYLFAQVGAGALLIDLANTAVATLMTVFILTFWRARAPTGA